MIVRAALLLLVALLVLGVINKWRRAQLSRREPPPRVQAARKCPACDAYVLGNDPEPCARPDCHFR